MLKWTIFHLLLLLYFKYILMFFVLLLEQSNFILWYCHFYFTFKCKIWLQLVTKWVRNSCKIFTFTGISYRYSNNVTSWKFTCAPSFRGVSWGSVHIYFHLKCQTTCSLWKTLSLTDIMLNPFKHKVNFSITMGKCIFF